MQVIKRKNASVSSEKDTEAFFVSLTIPLAEPFQ